MRKRPWRDWLLAALGGVLALGCEKAAVKPSYPPDPVLVHKRVVTGKSPVHSTVIVKQEPITPTLPESALATAPRSLSTVARTTAAKPIASPSEAHPDSPPMPGQTPVPAIPVVQTKPIGSPPAPPQPPPRPVAGVYGHAPDYAWIQGVIDRHYLGHMDLRFCDAATEEEWGGKVCLGDDPRLRAFQDGDVVFVEGELVLENGQPKLGRGNHYPLYHIRNVELVSHGR